MGRMPVNTEAETGLRRLRDWAQGCGTRSWRRRRRGKDPSLEPLEGAWPFDVRTGTSDL